MNWFWRVMIAGSILMAWVIAVLGAVSLFQPITLWRVGTVPSNDRETSQRMKTLSASRSDCPPAMRIWVDGGDIRFVRTPTVKFYGRPGNRPKLPKDSSSECNSFAFQWKSFVIILLAGDDPEWIPYAYGETHLTIHLWVPFILVAAYPTIVIVTRVYRRHRRRRKGLCLKCGYNLAGNVSGVCPECGERIGPDNPIDPACDD